MRTAAVWGERLQTNISWKKNRWSRWEFDDQKLTDRTKFERNYRTLTWKRNPDSLFIFPYFPYFSTFRPIYLYKGDCETINNSDIYTISRTIALPKLPTLLYLGKHVSYTTMTECPLLSDVFGFMTLPYSLEEHPKAKKVKIMKPKEELIGVNSHHEWKSGSFNSGGSPQCD